MAKFEVSISRTAEKSLRALPTKDFQRVLDVILGLSENPYPAGARKLVGEEDVFRVRTGVYRILYEVDGTRLIILVLKIGHRKDVYR